MQTTRTLRGTVKDVAIRAHVLRYRPLGWSATQWQDSFAAHHTDGYGVIEEVARYGVLAGYLSWLGGEPSVLDIGCGAGLFRRRLEGMAFSSYVGVDPTAAAVEQASGLADERTRFVLADPVTDDLEPADVVVCSEVIYTVADPLAFIDRLVGIVNPGGHLLTSIWRHPGDTLLWRRLDERFELRDRVAIRNPANPFAPRGWRAACHRRR